MPYPAMVNTHRHNTPSMQNPACHPQLSRSQRTAVALEHRNSQVPDKVALHWLAEPFLQMQGDTGRHEEGKVCRYMKLQDYSALLAFSMTPTPNRISS